VLRIKAQDQRPKAQDQGPGSRPRRLDYRVHQSFDEIVMAEFTHIDSNLN
jgi:hypothetical protein